jgi:hypothetical protein
MSSNRDRGFKRYLKHYGYRYRYKQLRDTPINQMSDEDFDYVVKSLLYAAMGRYKRRKRYRGRALSWGVCDGA